VRRHLYTGISELVQPHALEGQTREPLTIQRDAALLIENGQVSAAGPRRAIAALAAAGHATHIDLGDRAVLPGFIDSHTHVVFAGTRVDEMARRARGETYEQIAASGGGIKRSAAQLEQASERELVETALGRLARMLSKGTTTCEIKSGYGLLPAAEHKQLAAISALGGRTAMRIVATVLAHSIPGVYSERRAEYVALFCEQILAPAARAERARFCDVFVEQGVFTNDEARTIAAAARAAGLGLKLHVDQLHDNGGAEFAAELGATSADHLEESNARGRAALARAGVVATVLPGCRLFLGKGPWPAARALRDAGCEVAVATDCNPGSSMVVDLPLCAMLAATEGGLSLEEALWGITRGGARALALPATDATLTAGDRADFVVLSAEDWRTLFYSPGDPPIDAVVIGGQVVTGALT